LLLCAPKAYVLIFKPQSQNQNGAGLQASARWDVETQFKPDNDIGRIVFSFENLINFHVFSADQLQNRPMGRGVRNSEMYNVAVEKAPSSGSGGSGGPPSAGSVNAPSPPPDKKDTNTDLWD
jgi:hypothetical protein